MFKARVGYLKECCDRLTRCDRLTCLDGGESQSLVVEVETHFFRFFFQHNTQVYSEFVRPLLKFTLSGTGPLLSLL